MAIFECLEGVNGGLILKKFDGYIDFDVEHAKLINILIIYLFNDL